MLQFEFAQRVHVEYRELPKRNEIYVRTKFGRICNRSSNIDSYLNVGIFASSVSSTVTSPLSGA